MSSRKQAPSPPAKAAKTPEPAKKVEAPKKVVAPVVAKGNFDAKAFTKGGATE